MLYSAGQSKLFLCSVLATSLALSHAALAQERSDSPRTLDKIQVDETEDDNAGYAAARASTATKTDTPISEIPQSISVVTRERVREMGSQGVQDALNYSAGVRSDAYGLDTRSDGVSIRGGFPDEYLDGMRQQLGGYYTSTTRTEPFLLERLEVLRGPSSMLFGQGSTAGIVNLVSKQPLAETKRELGVRVGSFDRRQLEADFTGPITDDGVWLYRVVAVGRDADTQVDFVGDDRVAVAPSLAWHPSDATSLTLQMRFQKDKTGSSLQFVPWSGSVIGNPNGDIPTNRFLGEPDFEHYDSERLTAGWLFSHRLNEQWVARQNFRATRNEVLYQSMYPDVYSSPDAPFLDPNQRLLARYAYQDARKVRVQSIDQHLEGLLTSGAIKHQLLVGLDAARSREVGSTAYDFPPAAGIIDVFNPVYAGYSPPPRVATPKALQRQWGVYLQDQLKLMEHWIVTAGLRHDRVRKENSGVVVDDRATTKRLGVMYQLPSGWSPYVSYSESFTPVADAVSFDQSYIPLRGKQVEGGVKWVSAEQGTQFTAAVYNLEEENRLIANPNNPLVQIQTGETRNRGVEFELIGNVSPQLDIAAHYNYIDIDEALEGLPKHQTAVWANYHFTDGGFAGLSTALGVRYFGEFTDGGAPVTPDVTLFDATVAYERSAWRYALNAQNLADKSYSSTCLRRGDCFYGARRNVMASATYFFSGR